MTKTSNQGMIGSEQQHGSHSGTCSSTTMAGKEETGKEPAWETATSGLRSAASTVASTTENAWDEVTTFISRHPWSSLAFSGGIGYLLIHALSGPTPRPRDWNYSPRRYENFGPSARWRSESFAQPRSSQPRANWEEQRSSTSEGGTLEHLREQSGRLASSVADRASDAWESTRQGAQDMASAVASGAENALETVRDWSREYPATSPLVGFLAGAGCGLLAGWAISCQTSR